MSSSLGFTKTVVYSLLPLVLLLAVLEGTFRIIEIWRPPLAIDYGWGFTEGSRLFIPDATAAGRMATAPARLSCFVQQSFPMPKPAGNIRIFFVGGSGINYAEPALRTQEKILRVMFGGKHDFEFINAGGCGYGSHRLTPIVSEILNYSPDMIVFYEGGNEFQEFNQLQFVPFRALPYLRGLSHSAFFRFFLDLFASNQLSRTQREQNQDILRMTPKENGSWQEKHFTPEQIQERMDVWERNLRLIVSMCKARNVPLILSTVPSNLVEPRLADQAALDRIHALYANGNYAEGMACAQEALGRCARSQACAADNDIIRRVAKENDIPIADVESRIAAVEPHHVPGETFFYDHCHFHDGGFTYMMQVFTEQIVRIIRAADSGKS